MTSSCAEYVVNRMTVSVIIPIYNVEKYLEKCIKSVVDQTYKKLEIILVDDGSPDNSPAICEKWALKDNRIKVVHRKNGGLSAARNSGIDVATGEYFCFVDSDDYVAEDYVETLFHSIVSNDADVAVCDFFEVNDDTKDIYKKKEEERIIDNVYTGKEIIRKFISIDKFAYGVVWNKLYKRSLFSNLRFMEGKCFEDSYIMPQIFANSKIVNCISKPLYYYLRRSGSISGSFNMKHLDLLIAQDYRVNFIKKQNWNELLAPFLMNLLNVSIIVYRNKRESKTLGKINSKCLLDNTKRVMKANAKLFLSSKNIELKQKIRFIRYFIKIVFIQLLKLY